MDYIRAKNNVPSVSYILCTQVIKPQILSKIHKINPKANLLKTYTNLKHKIFEELVPSILPLLKKHIRLGHAGIVDLFVDLSIPGLKKKV